jgi:hypothetical protein
MFYLENIGYFHSWNGKSDLILVVNRAGNVSYVEVSTFLEKYSSLSLRCTEKCTTGTLAGAPIINLD